MTERDIKRDGLTSPRHSLSVRKVGAEAQAGTWGQELGTEQSCVLSCFWVHI